MAERKVRAKCVSAVLGLSKSGHEQVVIAFDVNGTTLRYWGGFGSENQIKQTIKALRACGWLGDDLSDLSTCSADAELVVVDEEYNGKQVEKIRFVNQIASTPALAADRARAFAEKMKRRIANLDDTQRRGQRDEEPPPPNDSDAPF